MCNTGSALSLVMRTFGGEVKGSCGAASLVAPVDSALPMGVLIIVQHAVRILTGVPELPKGHQGHCGIDVVPHCCTICTNARQAACQGDQCKPHNPSCVLAYAVAKFGRQGSFCGEFISRPGVEMSLNVVVASVNGDKSFIFSRLIEFVHMQLVLCCTHSGGLLVIMIAEMVLANMVTYNATLCVQRKTSCMCTTSLNLLKVKLLPPVTLTTTPGLDVA